MASVVLMNDEPYGPDERVNRFVLETATWQTYENFDTARGHDHPGLAITYYRGKLELRTKSAWHHRSKARVCRVVDLVTMELGVPTICFGQATVYRQDRDCGMEPDQWYYLRRITRPFNWQPDFQVDPPPDLAIEVEVSPSALNRIAICARLEIPEVWRFDGRHLCALHLQDNGAYEVRPTSRAMPQVRMADAEEILRRHWQSDDLELARAIYAWIENDLKPTS